MFRKKNETFVGCVIFVAFLSGCAAGPIITQKPYLSQINGSKEAIYSAAIQILTESGYQIQNSDKENGLITTLSRDVKLTEDQCDCGTGMGIPYMKDKRTVTTVTLGLSVGTNRLIISPTVKGRMVIGTLDSTNDKQLECVTTGQYEQDLFQKIVQRFSSGS